MALVCPCVEVHRKKPLFYEVFPVSPAEFSMSCSFYFDGEMKNKWPYSCCCVGCCFQDLFLRHATSLNNSHLAFSPYISLESWWCSHTIIVTWLQLERILLLFYQRLNFHTINNLSIVIYAFSMRKFTSVLVDRIWLSKYLNLSTNFSGLPFNEEIVPYCLKFIKD